MRASFTTSTWTAKGSLLSALHLQSLTQAELVASGRPQGPFEDFLPFTQPTNIQTALASSDTFPGPSHSHILKKNDGSTKLPCSFFVRPISSK